MKCSASASLLYSTRVTGTRACPTIGTGLCSRLIFSPRYAIVQHSTRATWVLIHRHRNSGHTWVPLHVGIHKKMRFDCRNLAEISGWIAFELFVGCVLLLGSGLAESNIIDVSSSKAPSQFSTTGHCLRLDEPSEEERYYQALSSIFERIVSA